MTKQEWLRLKPYVTLMSASRAHKPLVSSKRSVRANGRGTGQILKTSRIHEQVPMERVFVTRK